jgi:hypothetical protein
MDRYFSVLYTFQSSKQSHSNREFKIKNAVILIEGERITAVGQALALSPSSTGACLMMKAFS